MCHDSSPGHNVITVTRGREAVTRHTGKISLDCETGKISLDCETGPDNDIVQSPGSGGIIMTSLIDTFHPPVIVGHHWAKQGPTLHK